ncbi:MAG: Mitochondrial zinc maintenance protein 1, mitochondrial [Watsoniomyces obsoletus]|nr:MAG: Mitochondrial zinc maintenance protein 1, mitochondrial [Watsoniomyces obsoletus]
MPKVTSAPRNSAAVRRHNPIQDDISNVGTFRATSSKRRKSKEENVQEGFIDSKASRQILRIGQSLVEEEQAHEQEKRRKEGPNTAFTIESRLVENAATGEDDSEYEDEPWDGAEDEEVVEEIEVDPADLDTFNRIMQSPDVLSLQQATSAEPAETRTTNLADLILEKISAHEAAQAQGQMNVDEDQPPEGPEGATELPLKVVEVYTRIGILLSRYKSGKLPKLFKILPTLPNWHEILPITRPESWTPNACYEATRIFVSGKPSMTQIFLEEVILDRVREDIHDTKKLNVHLYKALKKALYKPAAFFKGILFPLVSSGSCTLREAHIVSSVLARVSVPVLHSAAALLRLCDIAAEQSSMSTEGGGATNIFIRTLLEKKYALPYKVIDALVFHFLRFRGAKILAPGDEDMTEPMSGLAGPGSREGRLPVLWHQCLLAFAQRYRNDITEDQREALLDLLLVKGHSAIGPEVRRELLAGRGRGVPIPQEVVDGGDDTMLVD